MSSGSRGGNTSWKLPFPVICEPEIVKPAFPSATLVELDAVCAVVGGEHVSDDDGQIARTTLVHTQAVAIQCTEAVAVELGVQNRDLERRGRAGGIRWDRIRLGVGVAGLVRKRLVVEQDAMPAPPQLRIHAEYPDTVQ